MTLIRRDAQGARIVDDDPWIALGDDDPLVGGDILVSFARWQREPALRARAGRVGVRVRGDVEPEQLSDSLPSLALVAIEFPQFTDGRGYSLARLLRSRYGFSGELRAVGDVLRDQIFSMARCGFDTFDLAAHKDPHEALGAFADFSVTYQPAEDHEQPIWRRRASET